MCAEDCPSGKELLVQLCKNFSIDNVFLHSPWLLQGQEAD